MYRTIWHYKINLAYKNEFQDYYNADGNWVQLFKKAFGYIKTELYKLEGQDDSYLTIDYWQDEESFKKFKINFKNEYEALDKKCQHFTLEENKLI